MASGAKKEVLICLHGYQTSSTHDLQAFKDYCLEHRLLKENQEISLVSLYEWENSKTYTAKAMYQKAAEAVRGYIEKGYEVSVLAYSFSAPFAGLLSQQYHLQKIILVSPTIFLVRSGLIMKYVKLLFKVIRLHSANKEMSKKVFQKVNFGSLVELTYASVVSIVHYRRFLKKVDTPLLYLKGKEDAISLDQTFFYIGKRSQGALKIACFYPKCDHMMIASKEQGPRSFQDIVSFVF
jgi:esterase/lipase